MIMRHGSVDLKFIYVNGEDSIVSGFTYSYKKMRASTYQISLHASLRQATQKSLSLVLHILTRSSLAS